MSNMDSAGMALMFNQEIIFYPIYVIPEVNIAESWKPADWQKTDWQTKREQGTERRQKQIRNINRSYNRQFYRVTAEQVSMKAAAQVRATS